MANDPVSQATIQTGVALTPKEIERGERLLYRLTEFGRLLWESGIDVGPGKLIDLAQTLTCIDLTNKEDFYNTLKCSLLSKHEQESLFNELFGYYWFVRDKQDQKTTAKDKSHQNQKKKQLRLPPSERKRLAEHLNAQEQKREMRTELKESERRGFLKNLYDHEDEDLDEGNPQGVAYSQIELLRKKDFESFSWDEIQEAKRLMSAMRWHVGMRATHRRVPARKGDSPDMRRLLRRNMKYGAELIELTWRQISYKPRPLVIICDISGSMSLYSRLLLHFVHTISSGLMNVESFVFGTRLTCITHQLKRKDVDDAVREVSKSVQDWSGGTRIGDSLHQFNQKWARRVLGHGAVVLVISDGWDRGDPAILRAAMDRLQHNSHRLIWLNPLLGSSEYRPLTIGMKTALPYIDDFLPAHNVNSLIALGQLLQSIDDSRPARSAGARRKAIASWTKKPLS